MLVKLTLQMGFLPVFKDIWYNTTAEGEKSIMGIVGYM